MFFALVARGLETEGVFLVDEARGLEIEGAFLAEDRCAVAVEGMQRLAAAVFPLQLG